jgi:uncharacterized protein YbcC (UPF0753/DUF2309 family)
VLPRGPVLAPQPSSHRLETILEHVAHYLPAQAPLEVFVHHNTLHAFQDRPFHEAVEAARKKIGGAGYLPEHVYRDAYARGRIAPRDLDAALKTWAKPELPSMPPGLPDASSIAKLVLIHGIHRETAAGLAWRLTEEGAAREFAQDVSSIAKARIGNETVAWLRAELAKRGPTHVATLISGAPEDAGQADDLLAAWLHRTPTETKIAALLERSQEAVAVSALWQACRTVGRAVAGAGRASSAVRASFLRDAIVEVGGDDPNDLVAPVLILLAGAFLDRGQSHWSMPDREHGFFVAFCRVLGSGHAVRPSWLGGLGKRLRDWTSRQVTAEQVVFELVAEIGVPEGEHEAFIEKTLLQLPGWAGMFRRLEQAPAPLGRSAARVRLVDYLAVRLVLDALALIHVARRLGHRGRLAELREFLSTLPLVAEAERGGDRDRAWPLFLLTQHLGIAAPEVIRFGDGVASVHELLGCFDRPTRLRIWQEAYEAHYRDDLLRAIDAHRSDTASGTPPRFQIVTCIDDRAEGLRRHFEELSPSHVTFGVAGFFNLAIAYQGIDDPSTFPLCPVVVTPRHSIREEPISEHASLAARRQWRRRQLGSMSAGLERASKSIVWGPVVTAVTGFVSALPLLAAVFAPFAAGRIRRQIGSWLLPMPKTRLTLPRGELEGHDGPSALEGFAGFTIEEKAARVGALFEDMGLTQRFARIVVICGHDSSSVNNPHVAAYSCGACGGRSGGPNARLFARMANRPEVRARLRARGIDVPDTTVFIGALHDTCADRIVLMDTDALPLELMPELAALQAALDEAARRHAHERCRRFASSPRRATFAEAWREVEGRSYDLSQARPELGHATNAACVVGRRALTRGLFLDRRVFLVSYDPTLDPSGVTLERILQAVGPVGAGINLEYFFSTTDNEVFGAGTKLPHNVTGLFGVMNGASSDLRTGLPKQMIEVHEPIRLQLVVETTREAILAITARRPEVAQLIDNEWLRLVVIDPHDGTTWVRRAGEFERWTTDGAVVPVVARSQDWYRGKSGHLGPARIVPHADGARTDVRLTIGDRGGDGD